MKILVGPPKSALKVLPLWVCADVAQHLQAQAQAGTGTAASARTSAQAWPSRIWPQRLQLWGESVPLPRTSVDIPVHSGVVSAACSKDMPCVFLLLAASQFIYFPYIFGIEFAFIMLLLQKKSMTAIAAEPITTGGGSLCWYQSIHQE